MRKLLMMLFFIGIVPKALPGEGMWLPVFLDSLNYSDMKDKGLRISPEEIYSSAKPSLKDAVVIFGNGCTGEIISPEGLLITNHHCGYSHIQAHSSIDKNYLADGFWAGSKSEELINPGLTVTFLKYMQDVTDKVLAGVSDAMPAAERNQRMQLNIYALRNEVIGNSHFQAEIKPLYYGKQYFLYVYEIFNDVRLVGAPPESIGNFGGDTDNWIWPRHTGDFSLFRIYAGKDNNPADYSPDNVPYKPKKYLHISTGGVKEGDFTMVLGYPGKTEQFLVSEHLSMIALKSLPAKIEMRTVRLNAIRDEINKGPEFKLRYGSKYKSISNSWKKWIGVLRGIEKGNVIENKTRMENEFNKWAEELPNDPHEYASLKRRFSDALAQYKPIYLQEDLGGELLNSIELSALTDMVQIKFFSTADSSEQYKKQVLNGLQQAGRSFFRTSALAIDRKVLPSLFKIYADHMDNNGLPDFYDIIMNKFQGDYQAYVEEIFRTSMFTDSMRFSRIMNSPERKIRNKIISDPLISIYRDFSVLLFFPQDKSDSLETELKHLYYEYVSGLMQRHPDHIFYPDANFTLRLTYGNAEGYKPSDGIEYDYYTTLDGVLEKTAENRNIYPLPLKLKMLAVEENKEPYAFQGKIPVCFIASNHTSGGNSGSPVLNAQGNLIGINFDRNWEGTVSDYAYNPSVCRNISLDIRYVIFIIDKLAEADWLLDELTITNN